MTRHLHIEPVDLVDLLAAEWAQEERAIASHRATHASHRAVFHRLGHAVGIAIARAISGDLFFLITGAMVALDLCLIVWLVQR